MEKSCSLSASVAAIIILELTFLISPAAAVTVPSDVSALQELYRNLNYPPQLVGWKSDGGDPCGESWLGISCDAASVVNIILPRLGLRGYIAGQVNLPNLKELVLSFNEIQGEIPYFLPLNITYIDLSSNKFHSNRPQSVAILKQLRYLNLSHNILSGTVGNYFSDLQNLQQMDLSYNSFSGELPSSFGKLTSLTGLFLQNNKFTGSVSSLENLPLLIKLNLQSNNFSGVAPKKFLQMANLGILGDAFQDGAQKPPWDTPPEDIFSDENASIAPTTQLSPVQSYLLLDIDGKIRKRLIAVVTAFGTVALAFVAICVAVNIFSDLNESRVNKPQDPEDGSTVLPASTNETRLNNSHGSENISTMSSDGTGVLSEDPTTQDQNQIMTVSTVLPNEEESDNCRKVYVELRNTIPYYLACLTIFFPITIPCGLVWIFVAFMTVCLSYFLWLGGEAFFHIQKMKKKGNGQNISRLATVSQWFIYVVKRCRVTETAAPLLEKSKSCENGSGWKVAAVTAFAVSYTVAVTVYTVCKPCTD